MVFGEAALSQRLAARSLEIEAGRVHEHEVELAEQIAPAREQLLFDDVLQAARRKECGAVLLIFAQLFAQPGHRPIKVMQVDIRGAIDGVILAPAVRRPIGAASKQAMQNGEKHRAFEREAVLAGTGEVFDHLRQPVSSHNRSKTSAGPIRRAALAVTAPSATALTTMAFAAKRAPDRSNRSSWPLSRKSSMRPSVAITCWRTCAPSRRLSMIWR